MKIYFDNVAWDAEHTGPTSFATRLAKQLSNMGHQLADPDDYDVALVFIEGSDRLKSDKPYVLRLDGVWFKPEQMKTGMNDRITDTCSRASHIVYQSEFDKQMVECLLHVNPRCPTSVIRNGMDIKRVAVRSEQLIEMRNKYDRIFVSSSHWHPQKRLRDCVEVFRRIRETQHPNSCLMVLGNNPDYHVADKGIFYAGSIRHDLCAEVYAIADWMIHMAWLDHCPNVVVEAIAQGCPVLCSSEGGTQELVMRDGYPSYGLNGQVIMDEKSYDFSLVDYDNPPRVPLDNIPKLHSVRAQPWTVDIVACAKKYEDALLSAL